MQKNYMVLLIIILVSSISYSQGKKVYDEGYIVKVGDKASDFTIREAGGKLKFSGSLLKRQQV